MPSQPSPASVASGAMSRSRRRRQRHSDQPQVATRPAVPIARLASSQGALPVSGPGACTPAIATTTGIHITHHGAAHTPALRAWTQRSTAIRRWIRSTGAALSPLDRALLVLYLEEHSSREIAEVLGLGESNVTTRISRLKQRIREYAAPSTPSTTGARHGTR